MSETPWMIETILLGVVMGAAFRRGDWLELAVLALVFVFGVIERIICKYGSFREASR
jgi:hypothetical protein